MIDREALEDQQWYDGFVWHKEVQKGVSRLKWIESLGMFNDPNYSPDFHYVLKGEKGFNSWCFEPNVVSIGEPAA